MDSWRHFWKPSNQISFRLKIFDIFFSSSAGSDKVRVYHLIVKSQPQNEVARRFLQPSHTFEKESNPFMLLRP
jgi:hypothetical protein